MRPDMVHGRTRRGTPAHLLLAALLAGCTLVLPLDGYDKGGPPGGGDAAAEASAPAAIALEPTAATVLPGETLQLRSVPASATPVWSIEETGGGTIDATGLYRAPFAAGSFHVVATAEGAVRASATITVPPALALLAGRVEGHVDGLGPAARFYTPSGCALDAGGNLYVADLDNRVIRKITSAGLVTTIAGAAGEIGGADGSGPSARFRRPESTAVDGAGNVFVADVGAHTVRRISPDGTVTTLAGLDGMWGATDGTGSAARFDGPTDIATDRAGNLFVADHHNHTIRRITPMGATTTVAGKAGEAGSSEGTTAARLNFPGGLAVDKTDTLYVADSRNHTIRKIAAGVVSTFAGAALQQGSDDGTALSARFSDPSGVAVDGAGNVFVADRTNHRIRKITPAGAVTTLAGSTRGHRDGQGTSARFNAPARISVASNGDLYVSEWEGHVIRKITPSGDVTTLAGRAVSGTDDGFREQASFMDVRGIVADAVGNAYVSDGPQIRKVSTDGTVTPFAGLPETYGALDGTGSTASFDSPYGLALDAAGNIYVTEAGAHTIRKITPSSAVSTVAGRPYTIGSQDGPASVARFRGPRGIAVDAANNLYVADQTNHIVRKITPAGVVSTLAGQVDSAGGEDGQGIAARFYNPSSIALEPAGTLLVTDIDNHTIRRIDATGRVTTVVGSTGVSGAQDGAAAALLNAPSLLAVDVARGDAFFGDVNSYTVRRLSAGVTTTIAGRAGTKLTALGALPAGLPELTGLAVTRTSVLVTSRFAVYQIVLPP